MPADTLEPVIRRGLPATLAVARQARRRILKLAASMNLTRATTPEFLRRARRELARMEPVLARVVTDSTIAAWVAAARPVAREAIPRPSVPDVAEPEETRQPGGVGETFEPHVARWLSGIPSLIPYPPSTTGESLPPDRPPPGQLQAFAFPEDEPLVRWPALEAGVRDLTSRRILLPGDYNELSSDAKAAAFTVARAVSRDAIETVRDAIVQDVQRGGTLKQFRERVNDAVGGVLNPGQIETLYRTQVGLAHSEGLRQVLEHPLVGDEFPFVFYYATHGGAPNGGDGRTRDEHMAMEKLGLDGTNCYWRDDPVIQRFWAPWSYNCRCVMSPATIEDAAAAGVREARQWLATGRPPASRTFVKAPPFDLPKGWPVRGGGIQSVRLSLNAHASAVRLSFDESKVNRESTEHDGKRPGEFAAKSESITIKQNSKHNFSAEFSHGGVKYTTLFHRSADYVEEMGDKAPWDIEFMTQVGDGPAESKGKTGVAGSSAVGALRQIGNVIDEWVEKQQPQRMVMVAERGEPTRVKIYDRLSRAIAAKHGYEVARQDAANVRWVLKRKQPVRMSLRGGQLCYSRQ